jgi:hypothetical protein
MSNPETLAVPAVGGMKQERTRIVVVLPAPLGPRKPTTSPCSTVKVRLSMAALLPYSLVRAWTSIMANPEKYNGNSSDYNPPEAARSLILHQRLGGTFLGGAMFSWGLMRPGNLTHAEASVCV